MNKKNTEIEIKDFLKAQGVPIAGISAVRQLPRVPEDFSPQILLKDAKSVVCYGVPIPKGIIYADDNELALYWRYCNMLYRSLDTVSNQFCLILEGKGYLATPLYGCFPWKIVDHEYWGLLPLVYWGEQAGLGKLTRCGLLAHPIYGTRILLGGLVTTLELAPSEKLRDELCASECISCIDVCPVSAIQKTGKVDHNLCIRHSGANPLLAHLIRDEGVKQQFSFETILNTAAVDDHGTYTCFECLKACPLNKV